jgi:basic membrane protein A
MDLRDWFSARARRCGLDVETDRNGNLWAWWGAPGPDALVLGSHLDSVPGGGPFDGPLGVESALQAVERLQASGIRPRRPLAVVVFAEEEGSFLVGAAAAQASKTGTVGFVGGVDTELIKKFEAGYTAGAEAVDPDIEVEVKYLTTGQDFSGFNDPAKGETTAAGLYDDGADVVYHASGGSGTGVFKAAAAADRLSIGVDSNQYLAASEAEQACMLTSMLKRVDVSVYSVIKGYLEGNPGGEIVPFSLENNGIGYATQGGQIVDEAQLEEFKQGIIDGDIEVPTEP